MAIALPLRKVVELPSTPAFMFGGGGNRIRNPNAQGVVLGTIGSGGTALPTNWSQTSFGLGGLTAAITDAGLIGGLRYISVRLFGTYSGSTIFPAIFFDTATGIAALQNQVFAFSLSVLTNNTQLSWVNGGFENNSGGSLLAQDSYSSPGSPSALTRFSAAATITNASTAAIQPFISATVTNGLVLDHTLTIAGPEIVLGAR